MTTSKRNTSVTKSKLSEKIQQELSSYLRKELLNPKTQFVSIVKVELNKDSSVANVFWDSFNSSVKEETKLTLDSFAPKMRKLLAKNLQLRHTPEVRLFYFSQYEDEHRIQQLLNKEKVSKE